MSKKKDTLTMKPEEMRARREKLGLSQDQLGAALGLRPKSRGRSVRAYELGERQISGPIVYLMRYIEKYGVLHD